MAKKISETDIDDIEAALNPQSKVTQVDQVVKVEPEQLSLDFFELSIQEYSNAIDIYDIVGKCVYSTSKKYLRGKVSAEETRLSTQSTAVNTKGEKIQVKCSIYAARIERKNNQGDNELVFSFPSTREDVIESVIRKFATDSRANVVVPKTGEHKDAKLISVEFSLYELYNELQKNNRKYSYPQIREALQILHDSKLEITDPEEPDNVISSTRLPVYISRIKNNKTMIYVCLHPLLSQQVKNMHYRRYNLKQELAFTNNYARKLYVRLSYRWIQAGQKSPYNILLSTLVKEMILESGVRTLRAQKRTIDIAMQNLLTHNVLQKVDETAIYDGRTIVDYRYELYPTQEFIAEMKKNNKYQTDLFNNQINHEPLPARNIEETGRNPTTAIQSYSNTATKPIKKLNRGLTQRQAAMFAQKIIDFCQFNPHSLHVQNIMLMLQYKGNDWNDVLSTVTSHLRSSAMVNEYLSLLVEVGFELAPKTSPSSTDDNIF